MLTLRTIAAGRAVALARTRFQPHRRTVVIEGLERRALLAAATSFFSRGPGGGGAFFAPSFSPYNGSTLFVSSDMSGLYRSTNTGTSWNIVDFREVQANRASQVQFTSDPNILYTIDYTETLGAPHPTRSADGGATWTRISDAAWDPSEEAYALYADPSLTTRLVVADYNSVYVSNDSGASFQLRYAAPNDGGGVRLAGAFFDGNNIYLGTSRGVLVSTNGGASFSLASLGGIGAGQTIFSFAGAKQGGVTRFFAVTLPSGDVYPGMNIEEVADSFAGLYSLDWGQANWTNRTSAVPAGDRPSFVSMARDNVGVVYAAGASTGGAPTVIKSTNGGSTFSDVLLTTNNANVATGWQGAGGDSSWGFGELAMAFQVSPVDPNRLAFTDFGYVHLSTDGGATWRQAYTSPADQNPAGAPTPKHKPYHGVGLEDTSALWLTWTNPTTMFAGYTDITGVRSTDGGASWSFPTYNPRQNTIYHVASTGGANPTLYASSSSVHDLYQSTYLTDSRIDGGTGRLLYSTDAGNTWNTLHDFANPVIYSALDPTNPNRMYASVVDSAVGGIYVTNNLNLGTASTWTKLPSPPRTQGHPFNIKVLNNGELVVSYSARRAPGFTDSSGVFYSTDGGQTWADRTGAGMQYWTKDIAIDPNDATQNTWYAAVRSGYGGVGNGTGGLYKTTNRGVNWTRVFDDASAESVTIVPGTGEMYVPTLDAGLWYSAGGATPTFTQLAGYPFRQPERVFLNPYNPSEVWVASFGYGLAVSVASTPATVTGAALQAQGASKNLTFTFNQDVSANPGTLVVTNQGTGATIPITGPTYNAGTPTSTFDLGTNVSSGRYRATLSGYGAGTTPFAFDFIYVAASQTLALPAAGQNYVVRQLTIEPDGTLDLTDNAVTIDYAGSASPAPAVSAAVASAYDFGRWDGVGITSALASADATRSTGVGWDDDGSKVRIRRAWYGDANLNGAVTADDVALMLTAQAAGRKNWVAGNFNFDARISPDDWATFSLAAAYAVGHPLPPLFPSPASTASSIADEVLRA